MGKSVRLAFVVIKEALLIVFTTPWVLPFAFLLTSSQLAELVIPQLSGTFSPMALRWIDFLSSFPILLSLIIGMIGVIWVVELKLDEKQIRLEYLADSIRSSFWDLVFFQVFLIVFIIPALLVYLPLQYFLATNSSLAPLLRLMIDGLIVFIILLGSVTIGISEAALLVKEMKGEQALKLGWTLINQNFLAILLLSASLWLLGQAHKLPYMYFQPSLPIAQIMRVFVLSFSYALSTVVSIVVFFRWGTIDKEIHV